MNTKFLSHPYLFAAFLVALFMGAVYLLFGTVFDTIDDYNVMMTLAGEKTGEPYWQLTFYSPCLSWAISLLYQLNNSVQWYSLIEIAMIYSSLVVIFARLFIAAKKVTIPIAVSIILSAVFFIIFFMYPVQRMQFTATSALLGTAAVSIICSIDLASKDSNKTLTKQLAWSVFFMFLCFAERLSAGYCLLVFWTIALAFKWFSKTPRPQRRKKKRKILLAFAAGVVLCGSLYITDFTIRHTGDNANYMEYNEYRAAFQDYPKPSYDQAKELYDSIGWGEEVYDLAASVSYLDESINKDSLKTIAESEEYQEVQPGLYGAIKLGVRLLVTNNEAKGMFIALVGLLLAILFVIRSTWKRNKAAAKQTLLKTLVFLFLSVILAFYLCLEGRFPLRSFQCISIPLSTILLILLLNIASSPEIKSPTEVVSSEIQIKDSARESSLKLLAYTILILSLGASCYICQAYVKELHAKRDSASLYKMAQVESYAISNPDKVFVYDFSIANSANAYDPFRIHPEGLTNLIISGGSYTYTGAFYDQLEENGLSDLYGESLLDDNVYYISKNNSSHMANVTNYLDSRVAHVSTEKVEPLTKNISVFKYLPYSFQDESTPSENADENNLASDDEVQ